MPAHLAQRLGLRRGQVQTLLRDDAQSGVFEAQENPLTNIYSSKLHEITKYISLTGHKYETTPLLASMAWWSSLSPEDQACVQTSADEATAFQREAAQKLETEVRAKLAPQGLEVWTMAPQELRRDMKAAGRS